MKTIITIRVLILSVSLLGGIYASNANAAAENRVARSQKGIEYYNDKNGYFSALPPTGWRQQDYPSETIRSKVEFVDAQKNNVKIRVIVGPVMDSSMSNKDILADIEHNIKTKLKPRSPNVKWSSRIEEVADREAVVVTLSDPGGEQQIVQYIYKGLTYSLALNAKSKQEFLEASPIFKKFLYAFSAFGGSKSFSNADRNASRVASLKRVALLLTKNGQTKDALQFVDKGLAIDPNNADLKAIRRRLTSKH